MSDGFYTAAAGAMAHIHAMDAISHNLANVSTTGFKQQVATFREVQRQADSEMNRQVVVDRIGADHGKGPIQHTGNPLDLAIRDDSFFVVEAEAGREQYTRAGSFRLDDGGILVTADGLPILSDSGPITVQPGSNVRIDESGRVLRENDSRMDANEPEVIGKIRRVRFERPELLQPVGSTRFEAPQAAEPIASTELLEVGALEGSNVSVVESMTEMIWVARAYEMFHRGMSLMDQTTQRAVGEIK